MAKRLISLRQIRAEKIDRGRTWISEAMAKRGFPKPVHQGGAGGNLWLEHEVDAWLERFTSSEKARAQTAGTGGAKRVERAAAKRRNSAAHVRA